MEIDESNAAVNDANMASQPSDAHYSMQDEEQKGGVINVSHCLSFA